MGAREREPGAGAPSEGAGPPPEGDERPVQVGDHAPPEGEERPVPVDDQAPPERPGRRIRGGGLARTLVLAVGIVAAVLAGVIVASERSSDAPASDLQAQFEGPVPLAERSVPAADRPLPEFRLDALMSSGTVTAADYRGAPLVLNFWATWCAPCVEEMPVLQDAAEALQGEVAFLGVNVNDSRTEAQALARRLDVTYDLAVEPTDTFAREVGVYVMPTTLFVDASGTIVHTFQGPLEDEQLRALLTEHLGAGVRNAGGAAHQVAEPQSTSAN